MQVCFSSRKQFLFFNLILIFSLFGTCDLYKHNANGSINKKRDGARHKRDLTPRHRFKNTNADISFYGSSLQNHPNTQGTTGAFPQHFLSEYEMDDTDERALSLEVDKEDSESNLLGKHKFSKLNAKPGPCSIETCFNVTKCQHSFKVYIYPNQANDNNNKIFDFYSKILSVIKESVYITDDPDEACLFIPNLDTIDQDVLSGHYVPGLDVNLHKLPYWNGGSNHIIFNLFSGTWPEYVEDMGFRTGKAFIAKASMSQSYFRDQFDVSFPLLGANHPVHCGNTWKGQSFNIVTGNQVLLSFKGKRYLTGIGSETRNALYHMHNEKDLVLLTTCRHDGDSWKKFADDRCSADNKLYDQYDYHELLLNSTFCLVPRGRRLGSFRFIEVIQHGCIPVILSNDWVLPFSDVIDWKKAAVIADERLLFQVPNQVRSIGPEEIFRMRQYGQHVWERYFSSVQKIVFTTLEIIRGRIHRHLGPNLATWNSAPGALLSPAVNRVPASSNDPLFWPSPFLPPPPPLLGVEGGGEKEEDEGFTILVYVPPSMKTCVLQTKKSVKAACQARGVKKVVVIWSSATPAPAEEMWGLPGHVDLSLIRQPKVKTGRLVPREQITTDAVFLMDFDLVMHWEEIELGYSVWRNYRTQLVGFAPRRHFWDAASSRWRYTSRRTDEYSIVLTGAAFIHRHFLSLYTDRLPRPAADLVAHYPNCQFLALNFFMSHVTHHPPIKVSQRHVLESSCPLDLPTKEFLFRRTQDCMEKLMAIFGYMPLENSVSRYDPNLFRDPVMMSRKKYKLLEGLNSD